MSFFGNLFGNKLQEVNISDLNLKSSDPLVTRATNMLVVAGLRNHSEFITLVDKVVTVMRHYQQVDVEASAVNIKKVLLETPPAVKESKKESKPKKPISKTAESSVTQSTNTTTTVTTVKEAKKPSKSVYKRKPAKKNT